MEVNRPIQNSLLHKEWRDRKGVEKSNKWLADISRNHNIRKRRVSCTLTTSITTPALLRTPSPHTATTLLPSRLRSITIRIDQRTRRCTRTRCRLLTHTMENRCTTQGCTHLCTLRPRICSIRQVDTCLLALLVPATLPTILTPTCSPIPTTIRADLDTECQVCRACLRQTTRSHHTKGCQWWLPINSLASSASREGMAKKMKIMKILMTLTTRISPILITCMAATASRDRVMAVYRVLELPQSRVDPLHRIGILQAISLAAVTRVTAGETKL